MRRGGSLTRLICTRLPPTISQASKTPLRVKSGADGQTSTVSGWSEPRTTPFPSPMHRFPPYTTFHTYLQFPTGWLKMSCVSRYRQRRRALDVMDRQPSRWSNSLQTITVQGRLRYSQGTRGGTSTRNPDGG